MAIIGKFIGGAGTGKTTELLRTMEKLVERLHDPHLIGFVSFTRAARREASTRAADRFDLNPTALENSGWFRTLHSVCYRCLGVGKELLADNKESREWVREALQQDASIGGGDVTQAEPFDGCRNAADCALAMWGTARNRLCPLAKVWEQVTVCDDRIPALPECVKIIERYEQAKRLDGRVDFVDLLTKFAGWYCDTDGAEQCRPDGEPPELPVWFFDEQQDTSALLDSVCKRLISTDECRWAYVCADPFQAIYGWAGADASHFMGWPAAKSKVMPKSYRCAAPILALGERILQGCSDYWDRKITPADHGGTVTDFRVDAMRDLIDQIDPREEWLLLARTNLQAQRIAHALDAENVPWGSTRGRSNWDAPVRNDAIKALYGIEKGAPINGAQWQAILKHLPSSKDGESLLIRGTKKRFAELPPRVAADDYAWMMPDELGEMGATDTLIKAIRQRKWRKWIKESATYIEAVAKWDQETVDTLKVRVGTIHSVKGAEADNVALLTTISEPCYKATLTTRGHDEEQRVFYVGATRARKRLLVANEPSPRFRKTIPVQEALP